MDWRFDDSFEASHGAKLGVADAIEESTSVNLE
jgi:hypothetical protein